MRSLIFAVLSALAPPLKAQRLHAKVDAIEAWRATLPEKKRIRRWRPSSARQRPMSADGRMATPTRHFSLLCG